MAAVVGVCRLMLHLPESHSLKDKRRVLRSLKDRLSNTYSVSVAETGAQYVWQSAELLVAMRVWQVCPARYAAERQLAGQPPR